MARTLAIGDVHGCDRALEALLDALALTPEDTVIFLGDLVDRGPASKQVLDRVLALRDRCQVIVIQGNHEELMRRAVSGDGFMQAWLDSGGRATIESYGGSTDMIPPEHLRLLLSAHAFHQTESHIFIHACLEAGVSLVNQTAEFLRWKHLGGSERPHLSGKRVICGHSPQKDGRPFVFDGWVCIDTFAWGGQWLTCLDVDHDLVVQANEQGETRTFALDDGP